ncbi:subtilisin-like protein [Hysterangium stoloniferum]|nr:subtilisin-like protein [Hysterangium stoloniferum]
MRVLPIAAFVLGLVGVSFASPSLHSRSVVHEKREFIPHGWSRSRRVSADAVLPMRFGLKQNNLHRLEEFLMEVSHPESPRYGQHWSSNKIAETFAPSKDTIDSVVNWLNYAGFPSDRLRLSHSKGWVELNATTAEAERLLDTEYHVYEHKYGHEHIACDSYSVPAHVRDHIDIILPTVNFDTKVLPGGNPHSPARRAERKGASINKFVKTDGRKPTNMNPADSLANCDEFITPACLRALYNFRYTPVATNKNSYGIVEFTPQAFLQGDLDLFFGNFSPSLVGTSPKLVSIDGGVAQTTDQSFDFNGESDLDLEYGMALVAPQEVTLLQAGDLVEGASFGNLLDALDKSFCTFEGGDDPNDDGIYPDRLPGGFNQPESCGIIKPPNVISTSYGSQEPEMTAAYQIRQCNEYAKLGMMGVTILYSSGDNGVAGFDGLCIDPATGQETRNGTRFNPGFPVNCPFLTAVGATQINPNSTVNDPEGACEQVIFSGGGFSDIFPMPNYQKAAVEEFFQKHPPPFTSAQFNNSRQARGYPDLSANGANYVIGIDGEFALVFGTSCSSPVVGSFITAINDARIARGKGPVGFINPTIYTPKFQAGFNDITSGGNQGCGTPGFTAVKGWDPVTGLGTPNVAKLIDLWVKLP